MFRKTKQSHGRDEPNQHGIDSQPDEILLHIFSFLAPKDRVIAGMICKEWRQMAADSTFRNEDEAFYASGEAKRYALGESRRIKKHAVKKQLLTQIEHLLRVFEQPSYGSSANISLIGYSPIMYLQVGNGSKVQVDMGIIQFRVNDHNLVVLHEGCLDVFTDLPEFECAKSFKESVLSADLILFTPDPKQALHVELDVLIGHLKQLGIRHPDNKLIVIANGNLNVGRFISLEMDEIGTLEAFRASLVSVLRGAKERFSAIEEVEEKSSCTIA